MKKLQGIINNFSRANILVVGDLILDEYIWGDVERISPEAPVPVVWAKDRTFVPGGAANVANNLRTQGARVSIAGVVGRDHNRDVMMSFLRKNRIDIEGIFSETGRHTTLKSRIFARHQQVVRVDWEHINSIKKRTKDNIIYFISKNIKKFDAIIIEDYGKGVIDYELLSYLVSLKEDLKKRIITVDPKEDHFEMYHGVTAITPNRKETENAIRYLKMQDKQNLFKVYKDKLITNNDIKKAGFAVLEHLNLESLLVTLGEQGMWLFENNGSDQHIPTVAQEVFDVSGAGDTTIATFTLALSCGATKLQAAHLANFAAGIVVGKVGTATVTRKELLERIDR
jgi:D-beta-D-heptose 7-phosphate kinase/D-beta-D-heptose 1-phosphate adenosyltransferase